MHTDEYGISLSRELNVCRKKIEAIRRFLRKMEEKYGVATAEFVEGYRSGKFPGEQKDCAAWLKEYEALKVWEERKKEFEEVYRRMKV